MNTLSQDLRYSLRMLIKRPGFTIVALITLALGIGANTAVFSVVNAVLLRPLPFPHSERLVYVWESLRSDPKVEDSMSPHNFTDLREYNQSFDAYFALRYTSIALTGTGMPESLNAIEASADFERAMGTPAAMGRIFAADEDQPGKNYVAVISDGFWKRRFGASAQVIGQSIQLNGEPHTIIGVMPAGFSFPNPDIDVWKPLALDLSKYQRGTAFLQGVARLKDGVTLEQARADLLAVGAQLEEQYPNNRDLTFKPVLLRTQLVGNIEKPLLVLFGAVVLVLLIACVNVANLVLGRATARWKEIALRSALGASRWSLIRLLLTESVLLGLLGGVLGLLLAAYGIDALTKINPDAIPNRHQITMDGFVIAFTFAMSLVTGVLFGLVPAWQATGTDLNRALREDSRTATGAGRLKLIRSGLVVAEIGLSLVLLAGAGLLLQSFWKLLHVNPGFRAENVVTCSINLPPVRYPSDWQQADFFRRTLDEVRALPGVEAAGFSTSLPFSGSRGTSSFSIDDRPTSRNSADSPVADRHQAAPGYFRAIGIPLLEGRDFSDADDHLHPGVVIINETAAKRYWPDENPIGKHLTIGMPKETQLYGKAVSREIIGIVGNVKHEELKDDFQPELYIPALQLPASGMTLVVRGQASAESLINDMRSVVQSVDKDQPIRRAQLLQTAIARSVAPQRFVTMLLMLFAGIALLLAAVGIYGVMSYTVAQRTHEIGIRIALGAQTGDVLRLVVGQGMLLAVSGLAIGLIAALALTRLMQTLLFNVSASDPITFVAIALLLGGVALLACYLPARRAAKVDPMVALRYE
jgi:putative ABC transport system permease protein